MQEILFFQIPGHFIDFFPWNSFARKVKMLFLLLVVLHTCHLIEYKFTIHTILKLVSKFDFFGTFFKTRIAHRRANFDLPTLLLKYWYLPNDKLVFQRYFFSKIMVFSLVFQVFFSYIKYLPSNSKHLVIHLNSSVYSVGFEKINRHTSKSFSTVTVVIYWF